MARISVTVSPGASRSELVERHGDGWRVRIAAPPERGRANEALCKLLAGALGIPHRSLEVVAGKSARVKVVVVGGLERNEIERQLSRALSS